MASPSMVQRSGDTLIVRSVVSGDRLFMDVPPSILNSSVGINNQSTSSSRQLSPNNPTDNDQQTEGSDLPECKIKRNYNCVHDNCDYFTQNPRHYLVHIRDVHDEKVKIYDCPHCLYASRHFQKLLRHMKMVHGSIQGVDLQSLKNGASPEQERAEPIETLRSQKKDNSSDSLDAPDMQVKPKVLHSCSLCPFTTVHPGQLTRHERKDHIKTKFFPCSKCNYVTHIKARFTKHVKYHSMPMIKCDVCDFRTPYKWNLDRHMKNHGGTGAFYCSACNFTADIKQSLTVHEMNHHIPPAGQGASGGGGGGGSGAGAARRRNKVGGSDALAAAAAALAVSAEQSNHYQPPESPQDKSSDLDIDNSTGDSLLSDSNDMEIISTENSNDKSLSDFPNINGIETNSKIDKSAVTNASKELSQKEDDNISTHLKKIPRPIPNLIPLNAQTPNSSQKTQSNGPLNLSLIQNKSSDLLDDANSVDKQEMVSSNNLFDSVCNDDSNDNPNCDNLSIRGSDESSQHSIHISTKTIFKKKNASFFDKLKEKLMTTSVESGNLSCKDCGHVSKCLSEHSVHEKICTNLDGKATLSNFSSSGLGSTRCQYCRHRCKSSLDLVIHMQSCSLAGKDRDSPVNVIKTEVPINPESEEEASVDDPQAPHPMENVVFVWNSMLHNNKSQTYETNQTNPNDSMGSSNALEENSFSKDVITSTPTNRDIPPNSVSGNGKKVFKCPHCAFWASTASRFHVHIVGHLNKKPFECSLCSYRSNWRWDITKHIRLKSVRDPDHSQAKVLMTDETGRRNYSKYNKYLTLMQPSNEASSNAKKQKDNVGKIPPDFAETISNIEKQIPITFTEQNFQDSSTLEIPSPFHKDTINEEIKTSFSDDQDSNKKVKKSMWKCKKCSYRNTSKEALLIHVRKHSKFSNPQDEARREEQQSMDPADVSGNQSYRCGHCYQRHCRLKHNGDVKVLLGENTVTTPAKPESPKICNFMTDDGKCTKCPFSSEDKNILEGHVKKHFMSADSIYKCYICSYYVNTEYELIQHLPLHGVLDPDKYMSDIINSKVIESTTSLKRFQCTDCPYESNSKSQFMYHEQFHKSGDAPFKCEVCNYQVSKRHLLHQHMKVHGINYQKDISDCMPTDIDSNTDMPLMWVSFEGEFQKMYKCRYCPYLKQKKFSIIDHEKMHILKDFEDTDYIHECPNCTFVCDNMDIFLSHCQVHKSDYAKILCEVQFDKSDEEQINHLKNIMNISESSDFMTNNKAVKNNDNRTSHSEKKHVDKILYFCSDCPARFLVEKEMHIHKKFHNIRLPYQCPVCSYTARQQAHLMAHSCVHSEDYQEKTRNLQELHDVHPNHKQPDVKLIVSGMNISEPVWIAVAEGKKPDQKNPKELLDFRSIDDLLNIKQSSSKHFVCNQCPAKFFKNAALHYHLSLHGGNGQFKCKQCNYAVKTIGNLVKHESVHGNVEKKLSNSQIDYESGDDMGYKNIPISGTDLFHHKTEVEKRALSEKLVTRPNDHFPPVLQADPQFGLLMHGNPDFIYPTYLKNGRQKEKRYKCHKCPSAFEKREQYKVHLSLHGSKQRYKCELCDYSVKYYANYVQHMRKHQMNADAHAARQGSSTGITTEPNEETANHKNITLAIKTLPRYASKDSSKLSVSDQQTLKLLHRRRSSANSSKDVSDEKKVFRCSFCPYINQRRDALDNHMRRHSSVSGIGGNFECPHCDYAAPQSHILREHLKVHFNTQKYLMPEYFTNYDGLEVYVRKVSDLENVSENKVCIYKSKLNEEITFEHKNKKLKIFVVPCTGERTEQMEIQ